MVVAENDTAAGGERRVGLPLSVEGLSVVMARSGVPVVTDVSFSVGAGQVMGLVGESGSGKSTVGLATLGYARRGLRIAAGKVMLGETDVLTLSPAELRRTRGRLISYVPQDPASGLNPALRIAAQLREVISIHKGVLDAGETVDDRARQILEEVNLPLTDAFLRSFPHQMSGGQQQRIGIAMAFACRPRLIVLDEPTTGLDVTTQRHILDTINALTERHGATAVYVSHDLPVVAQVTDTTSVMYAGRLVEHAPTRELFSSPRNPYTVGLIEAAPTPDRSTVLVGIEGQPPRPGRWPRGCTFADRCPRVQDACRESEPPLAQIEEDRLVRCFFPVIERQPLPLAAASVRTARQGTGGLEVSALNASYGAATILHGVDLTIEPGACLAVVGESGSGKTTLARCLAGLHERWEGRAEFEGETLDRRGPRRSEDQRRRIQYVFQNPYASLNPRMSVAENVEEPLRLFERIGWRERRGRVLETLDRVALGRDFADRMPGQLSGGERQRVAVARALVVEPHLLICDEITSALDVSVQALLVEQLRRLQQERGLTMLFITHNLSVVRSIAQNVLVLERGAVVETDDVETILERPSHPYTRQLLEDLPRFAS